LNAIFRTFVGVSVGQREQFNLTCLEPHIPEETIAFHVGVLFACYLVLGIADRIGTRPTMSDIRREFRFSLIPLTLLYSSLTKLFLLFLLTIWRPSPGSPLRPNLYIFQLFDADKIDREWVVRNVLGGMSAGFGLRGAHILVCSTSALTATSCSGLPPFIHDRNHHRWMGSQNCRVSACQPLGWRR
jgi:hypothetical protein